MRQPWINKVFFFFFFFFFMSLLISGTSAAHYSLPFLSSFFRSYPQCDYCPTRQPDDIFYSLSESTVKD